MEVNCDICGKTIDRAPNKINEGRKQGWKIHCSKECLRQARALKQIPCPVCGKLFAPFHSHGRTKTTCSHGCSNTYFRSGVSNHKFKGGKYTAYRAICFRAFPYKCAICEEANVVEVHHLDKNSLNNELWNLIPLCPTHHKYMHRKKLQPLIADKLTEWFSKYKEEYEKERLVP